MDQQITLTEDHIEGIGISPYSNLKVVRGLDSFDRFLGHLDPIKSSSHFDFCLGDAQELVNDDVDDEESLYSSSGDEKDKDTKAINMLHHSGDLERLFKSKSSSMNKTDNVGLSKAPPKRGRRPTASLSPKITSTSSKTPPEPRRPSSASELDCTTSLSSSSSSSPKQFLERGSQHSGNKQQFIQRPCRPRRSDILLGQTEHASVDTTPPAITDDLSKTEHTNSKISRYRRDELYSQQRKGNRRSKPQRKDPTASLAASRKRPVRRPTSSRRLKCVSQNDCIAAPRSQCNLREPGRQRSTLGGSTDSSLLNCPSRASRYRRKSTTEVKLKRQSEVCSPSTTKANPTEKEPRRPVHRHRSRSSCGSECSDSTPHRRRFSVVEGEITNPKKKPSKSPTRPSQNSRDKGDAVDATKQDGVGDLL